MTNDGPLNNTKYKTRLSCSLITEIDALRVPDDHGVGSTHQRSHIHASTTLLLTSSLREEEGIIERTHVNTNTTAHELPTRAHTQNAPVRQRSSDDEISREKQREPP